MEQFELRFIVCGSDLAATRECAKILFEAPLPGKVTLRQDGKFLFGTVTIGYAGAASPDWQDWTNGYRSTHPVIPTPPYLYIKV